MARCANANCGNVVNEKKAHIRLQDRVWCSNACLEDWNEQNARLTYVAWPFHDRIPKRFDPG